MNEKLLEKKLRDIVVKFGAVALKFVPTYFIGAPDRLILIPGGKIFWVEVKSTGENLRKVQETRKRQLEKLGFKVFKLASQEDLDRILVELKKEVIRI